jgi:hypothetical protein
MRLSPATVMRHLASTLFVFLALFVVCGGAQALPYGQHTASATSPHSHLSQAGTVPDDPAGLDERDCVPSLEDNSCGVDDTFDTPLQHAMTMLRLLASRPLGLAPAPAAHHPSLDLRPPIA